MLGKKILKSIECFYLFFKQSNTRGASLLFFFSKKNKQWIFNLFRSNVFNKSFVCIRISDKINVNASSHIFGSQVHTFIMTTDAEL